MYLRGKIAVVSISLFPPWFNEPSIAWLSIIVSDCFSTLYSGFLKVLKLELDEVIAFNQTFAGFTTTDRQIAWCLHVQSITNYILIIFYCIVSLFTLWYWDAGTLNQTSIVEHFFRQFSEILFSLQCDLWVLYYYSSGRNFIVEV